MAKLSGIRVLDLSRFLAGPYCTALLADLGAEVLKIEPPQLGDDTRHIGPFKNGESVYFALINRGKKSLTLNLKHPEALTAFYELVREADVVVENFRPGVARRLGVDYASLKAVNPRLIYASISGFGQDGPYAQRPAYDIIAQAMSGLMSVTGHPNSGPTRVGESLGDLCAGLFAAWAICAALYGRERTGCGEHLDVAMFDALFALQVTGLSQLLAEDRVPGLVGNRHPLSTPFDTYRASDGLVVIAVANEPLFARLAALLGRPELPADPRFASDSARTAHEPELRAVIEAWTGVRSVAEVCAACEAAGIPASPVWDLRQAAESVQARARGLVTPVDHPAIGPLGLVGQPVKFTEEPAAAPACAPNLGDSTTAILAERLGYTPARIQALRQAGAI
ncbi:MAG TPA: CoA transferase [Candidatus Competibacteraceae bacterium]|nr:CoA transferase [Candidatus Competibacteraceae bacterium]